MLKYILPVIALAFASSAYAHCGSCGTGAAADHKHDKAEKAACCKDGKKCEKCTAKDAAKEAPKPETKPEAAK